MIETITPVDKLVEWLARTGATYFTCMPVTIAAVAEEALLQGIDLKLDATIGYGMQARTEYRRVVHDKLNAPIIEVDGSEECGPIAVECPNGSLHINSELIKVDIVNDEDRPCPLACRVVFL